MFSQQEYAQRLRAARAALHELGLAALLVFAQESQYYLFGYDGGGYVFFPHVMLGDVERRVAIGLGNTVLVTSEGAESLTRHSLEMIRA